MGKYRKPARSKKQTKAVQLVVLVLVAGMALSLAAYYFQSSGGSTPVPSAPAAGYAGGGYVDQGNTAYDAGDYPTAIRFYEKAVAAGNNSPGLLTDLGTAYFYKNPSEPDKALEYYARALKVQPNFTNAMFNTGVVLRDGKGQPEAAIATWEKLLASLPAGAQADKVKAIISETKAQLAAAPAPSPSTQRAVGVPAAQGVPAPAQGPAPAPVPSGAAPQGGSRLSIGFGR